MVIRTSQINDYGHDLITELINEAKNDGQSIIILQDKPSLTAGTIMSNADLVIDCMGYVPTELSNKYAKLPTKVIKETLILVDTPQTEG